MSKYLQMVSFLLIFPIVLFAQIGIINDFESAETNADTSYWGHEISESAPDTLSYVNISYVDSPVSEGSLAMKLDYRALNIESWGGYAKIEHYNPDSNAVYDWSAYDSISFDYYVAEKQTEEGKVHLRFNLYDVSNSVDGNNTYTVDELEHYYSFHYILDNEPGWHRETLVLKRTDTWDGTGFTYTGWSGISGNDQLDKDKIKGFSFEFSIAGGGEGDYSEGSIIIDQIALRGLQGINFVVFNGMTVTPSLSAFTWGQSSLEVEEGTGATPGTNAVKWTQGNEWGNGWTGAGWNIDPPANFIGSWPKDSLHFKLKAPAGTGALRVQFEDGAAKLGQTFDPIADDTWHNYAFKLNELVYEDGTSNFDSTHVTVFQIMAEASGVAGTVIYLDDIWTGTPDFDWEAPDTVTGVGAVPAEYYNLVYWTDVPDEEGESYNVYASMSPITDINDPGVEMIASGVYEGVGSVTHRLYYPLHDKNITSYYAVECVDAAGNVGAPGFSEAVTNMGQGVPTIANLAPAGFNADGTFEEWANITPWTLKPSENNVAAGSFDNDDDLSATVYLAMDDDYLYVAADVIDNIFTYDPAVSWWTQDAFELYLGLWDQNGKAIHKKGPADSRGEEPDYKFIFLKDRFYSEYKNNFYNLGNTPEMTPDDPDYFFTDYSGADYSLEAKISLDSIAFGDDARFHPQNGMRIMFDLVFHDNDNDAGSNNLSWSPNNRDLAYLDQHQWTHTWIGDTTVTGISDKSIPVAYSYKLEQNYPNPFNPTTTIKYNLAKNSRVEITVFNVLGKKVKTLVKANETVGSHQITFNGQGFSSGVYFYQIKTGQFTQTKKMLLIK